MAELTGRRVLVVDDEPMVRFMVADELAHLGCLVQEADDGLQALEALSRSDDLDLVVTDIRMPHMDGWTLAERARELRPSLPVLYVTGYSDVASRPVPGAEVLAKPFMPSQLVAAVERALS